MIQHEQIVLHFLNKVSVFFGYQYISDYKLMQKIVHDIFNKYWSDGHHNINKKINQFINMYVHKTNKHLNHGYTSVSIDLILVLSAINFVILYEGDIDLTKLLNLQTNVITKIYSKTFYP